MIETDYPRPSRYRSTWRSLNGPWAFDFFDDYLITNAEQRIAAPLHRMIEVPYTYQTPYSGINETEYHPCMIYRKEVRLTDRERSGHLLLHFGAVDYQTSVWIDGTCIGTHTGGYTPFSFDISEWNSQEEITITCEVIDTLDPEQPRGKQSWCGPVACWYTPVSGIWQSVWLETVPVTYIAESTTTAQGSAITTSVLLNEPLRGGRIKMIVSSSGVCVGKSMVPCDSSGEVNLSVNLEEVLRWSIHEPNLYDIDLILLVGNEKVDMVQTYTAFREISWGEKGICINGQAVAMHLVLNQGYWPESGYTPPHDMAFHKDIKLMKDMGFNGCRMHAKYEDPRFYYWADHEGFVVWEEAPSFYQFSEKGITVFQEELEAIIGRNRVHPSIIVRVICNESWGILDIKTNTGKQQWLKSLVGSARELDPERLVIDNDGWEHLPGEIMTFHSYEHEPEKLADDWNRVRQALPGGILSKQLMVKGSEIDESMPMMLTEFGGMTYLSDASSQNDWGYGSTYYDEQEFLKALSSIVSVAGDLPDSAGWCYTQFSDVYQEKNGLVDGRRIPKAELELIAACIRKRK